MSNIITAEQPLFSLVSIGCIVLCYGYLAVLLYAVNHAMMLSVEALLQAHCVLLSCERSLISHAAGLILSLNH